jgi:hypothetical protein
VDSAHRERSAANDHCGWTVCGQRLLSLSRPIAVIKRIWAKRAFGLDATVYVAVNLLIAVWALTGRPVPAVTRFRIAANLGNPATGTSTGMKITEK